MASIYKHRNQWRAEIRKKGHAKVGKLFSTKARAQTWATAVEADMDAGRYRSTVEAERTSLGECIDRYLKEVSPLKRGYKMEILRWQGMTKDFKSLDLLTKKMIAIRSADIARYRDAM